MDKHFVSESRFFSIGNEKKQVLLTMASYEPKLDLNQEIVIQLNKEIKSAQEYLDVVYPKEQRDQTSKLGIHGIYGKELEGSLNLTDLLS